MPELDDKVHEELTGFCQRGDLYAEQGDGESALVAYEKALNLIPEPRYDYAQSVWVFTGIGDVYFLAGRYEKALDAMVEAVKSADGLENPFIHLRLGQCYFELGLEDKAANELTVAYGTEGAEIFKEDDPKYFEFLKTKITIDPPKKKRWWQF